MNIGGFMKSIIFSLIALGISACGHNSNTNTCYGCGTYPHSNDDVYTEVATTCKHWEYLPPLKSTYSVGSYLFHCDVIQAGCTVEVSNPNLNLGQPLGIASTCPSFP
jgi:hypothetical protein